MRQASKLAIVDNLLPLVEAFGASRRQQTELRRSMRSAACTHPDRTMDVPDEEGEPETKVVPCYDTMLGRTPWCEACRQHDGFFSRLMAERRENKKRLQKIERLAVAYAMPEPAEEPERKELFELLHALEQEEVGSAAAAIVREGTDQEKSL
jgi:hypothetical protein